MRSNVNLTRRNGLGTLEVVVASLISGVLLASALQCLGANLRSQQITRGQAQGVLLVHSLLEEIAEHAYRDPDEVTGSLGFDSGESSTQRNTFDDVDDYSGWFSSPPVSRDGNALDNTLSWEREVEVDFVLNSDVNTTSSSETGIKRVRVIARQNGIERARAEAVFTAAYDEAQP